MAELIDHHGMLADRSAGAALAALVAAVSPRIRITFGLPDLAGGQEGSYLVDAPDAAEPVSTDAFFARRPGPGPTALPRFFDLAVIGPGYVPAARRAIVERLRPLANRRSVLAFLDTEWTPDLFAPFDAARFTCVRFAGGVLAAGLDAADDAPAPEGEAQPAPGAASGDVALAGFLARHRFVQDAVPAMLRPSPDAPAEIGETAMPRYRDIARPEREGADIPAKTLRAVAEWWGRPVRQLTVGMVTASEVGFLRADGANRAVLIDGNGAVLPASLRRIHSYGVDAAALPVFRPPHHAEADGRLYPLDAARSLLSGVRHAGEFYLLGMMDKRFGHFLTESLATAWAVDWAVARGMRVLVWGALRPYHFAALDLLGVPRDRIVRAEAGAVYETLHIPDPAYRLSGSVAQVAGRCWDRMGQAALTGGDDALDPHPFLYLSRAGIENRALSNELALEELLRARGGRVVRPETLGFRDQVALVRRARAIVGCFGSQLHLSMFARAGTRKLVIGAERFILPEEVLIGLASGVVTDHHITPTATKAEARTASWTLDLDRFAPLFDRWLAGEG